VVTTQYLGPPSPFPTTVAAPIEPADNGVEDMLYLYRQATSTATHITVTFTLAPTRQGRRCWSKPVAIAQPQFAARGSA